MSKGTKILGWFISNSLLTFIYLDGTLQLTELYIYSQYLMWPVTILLTVINLLYGASMFMLLGLMDKVKVDNEHLQKVYEGTLVFPKLNFLLDAGYVVLLTLTSFNIMAFVYFVGIVAMAFGMYFRSIFVQYYEHKLWEKHGADNE